MKHTIMFVVFYGLAFCLATQHQLALAVVAWSLGTWPLLYVAGR